MNGSIYSRYTVEKLVMSSDTTTFSAHDTTTGERVFLHMLPPLRAAPQAESLLRTARDRMRAGGPVVQVVSFADAPCIVTGEIPGFPGLAAWLASDASGKAAPAPVTPPQPPVQPVAPEPPPPAQSVFAAPPPAASVFAAPPPAASVFAAPPPAASVFAAPPAQPAFHEPPPPTPPALAVSPQDMTPIEGDFTRRFKLHSTPEDRPGHPPPEELNTSPGTFTRIFESPLASKPIDVDAEQTVEVRKDIPFREPNEFERLFGPSPGAGARPSAEFSRADALGSVFRPSGGKAETPFSPHAADYDAVAARPAPAADAPPAPAPQSVPTAIPARRFERKTSYWLWIGGGVGIALLLALFAFLLSR
jgi:hypothetical protein